MKYTLTVYMLDRYELMRHMCVGDYLSEELSVRLGLVAWMSGPWASKEISKEEINTNLETILPTHYVSVLGWLLVLLLLLAASVGHVTSDGHRPAAPDDRTPNGGRHHT
jgi:hypothetical protein